MQGRKQPGVSSALQKMCRQPSTLTRKLILSLKSTTVQQRNPALLLQAQISRSYAGQVAHVSLTP